MKKIEWRTPNRMNIDTGHNTFDSKCDLIGVGNVLSDVQTSSYIRPADEIVCNGQPCFPGRLRDFDLDLFVRLGNFPPRIVKEVKVQTTLRRCILYRFFHYRGRKQTVHGYVLTDDNYNLIQKWVTGPTRKSLDVISVCAEYVCN